ncbi:MAG: hypothetical protein ACXVH6_04215 [Halobacteriota archaeon]
MENHELTPIIKDLITTTSLALTSAKNDFTIDSSGFGSLASQSGLTTNSAKTKMLGRA